MTTGDLKGIIPALGRAPLFFLVNLQQERELLRTRSYDEKSYLNLTIFTHSENIYQSERINFVKGENFESVAFRNFQ